ncbi:insulin-degrading enzyme-like [Temnothorax longispinosus]|uniref:insulin-degrading enzyme-like n=1 Tax=Temnothorax longispinosus TaxID=300112 RepID=UPI003A998732
MCIFFTFRNNIFESAALVTNKSPCVTVKNPYVKPVKKRFDNIKHADNRKYADKLYRGLVLKNKMKILLISDSKADMSIAAMDVNIGYNCDTWPLLGLAHLCEHMLSMGTKKFSAQDDYDMYVSQSNGQQNAMTSLNSTNYYFTVTPDKLNGALDRFAQFFIAPLFDEDLIETAIHNIDSEFNEMVTEEKCRLIGLEKVSIKMDHPYSKFGLGDKETLDELPKKMKINVRTKLKEFYKKYYSANIMSLCILSKDSLDVLENMVVERHVKNKKVELSMYSGYPFKDDAFNTKWYYVPKHNIRWLCISFSLFKIKREHQMVIVIAKIKISYGRSDTPYINVTSLDEVPLEYIEHLFKYESEGSLLSALKAKGWCDKLEIIADHVDTNTRFFKVVFYLTKKGINHVDNIVRIMFQYINMLKEDGPQKWIYEEIQKMSEINNSYDENIHRLSHKDISRIACQLHECPMEEIFSEQRAWQPDLIEELIKEHFTPQKIRIYVAAKEYESIANNTEEWFDIKYKKKKISKRTMDMWKHAGRSTDLKFPPENEFIPKKFVIEPHVQQKFPEQEYPVMDTSLVRVWHKQDNVFDVPKVTMILHFVSPFAYMDPCSSNLTDLFVEQIRKSLNEYTYRAKLAGVKWQITGTKYGIIMKIDGYDEKQRDLLERSMEQMINFEIDPKWIERKSYKIKCRNFNDIYQKTVNYLEMLVTEQQWLNDELIAANKSINAAELDFFITKLFSKMHVECLIYGNMTKDQAETIGQLIEIKLKFKMSHVVPLLQKQLLLYREIKLENGCHVRFEEENKVLKTSSTIVYYSTGLRSTESNMLLLLSNQIINQRTFHILRINYNLGYTVFSQVTKMDATQYLTVVVQGNRYPPYVENVIDTLFMENMYRHICTMSKEEFENHKKGLNSHLTAFKTRSSQCTLYWEEIERQEYNFDREAIEVDYLKKITQEQLRKFFEENIFNKSTRRMLSVHVMSTAMAKKEKLSNTSGKITVTSDNIPKKFNDLLSFKLSQSLYPLLEPIDKNFNRKPYEMLL